MKAKLRRTLRLMWGRFEEWAIPVGVRGGDLLELRRAELVLKMAAVAVVADLLWSPVELVTVSATTGLICVAVALLFGATAPLMRWTECPRLAAHYFITLASAPIFVAAWLSGGDSCVNLLGIILGPPLVALLIRGWRSTLAWTLVYAVGVWAYHQLHSRGMTPPAVVAVGELDAVIGYFIIFMTCGACVLALIFDRTNREALEEARARGEELEVALREARAADAAKGEFLSIISHELRTPMNGVIGMTDLLLSGGIDGEDRECVEIIRQSAEELLEQIEAILDFAGLEAGRVELACEPFTPRELVEGTQGFAEPLADDRGLELTYDFGGLVDVELIGDPGKLRRALLNLLSNALKFTERGGVRVGTRCRRQGERYDVEIAVEDTGLGIDERYHQTIFERFTQVDASFQRRFGGVGLGLAVAREIVRTMGGEILVESAPDEGSVFTICVSLEGAEVPLRVVGDEAELPEVSGGRVLLVEDNPINRVVAIRMLEQLGFEVETAVNGRIAVERVREGSYDLVLMDCQMPELDGLEATRIIRKLGGRRGAIPIVALTANAREEDRRACLAVGMDDFLSKPVTLAELNRVLAVRLAA